MNDIITVKLSIKKANSNIKLLRLNHVKDELEFDYHY